MRTTSRAVAYLTAFILAVVAPISLVLTPTTAQAVTQNIDIPVPNGTFENTEDGPLTSWTRYGLPSTEVAITDAQSFDGSHSMLVAPTEVGSYSYAGTTLLEIEEGKDYEINLQAYVTGTNPLANVYARTVNASGGLIDSTNTPANGPRDQWNTVTHAFTAPEGAVGVLIWLYTGSNAIGQHYFDNVTLTEIVPPAEPEDASVPNGTFENTEDGPLTSWTRYGLPSTDVGITDARAFEGDHSMLVAPTQTGSYSYASSARLDIEEGKDYEINLQAYVTGTNPLANVYARTVNASGGLIDSTFTPANGPADQWNTVTHAFTAPEGAVGVLIWLYTGSNAIGQHYFDNVTLTEIVPPAEPEDASVPNGTFENTEDGPLTSWTRYGLPSTDVGITDARAFEGDHSMLVAPTQTGSYSYAGSVRLDIEEGKDYRISLQAYVTGDNPLASVYARTLNASGGLIDSTFTPATGPQDQWNLVTHDFTAPTGAVGLLIWLYTGSNAIGEHYFDNVTITEIEPLTETQVLNPGFEELNSSGGPAVWNQTHGTGNSISISQDPVFAGDNSLRIHDTSDTLAQGVESNKFPIDAGVHYRAVAQVYRVSGTPSMYLRFYNATGQLISSISSNVVTPANQWGIATADGESPAGATQASILLYSGGQPITDTYYDEISITTSPITTSLIGPQHESINAFISTIGKRADGQTVGYVGTYGTPAAIAEVDLTTGEVLASTQLPGAAGVWGLTVAPNGDVYAGTLSNGSLYRWSPNAGPAVLVGKPVATESYINALTVDDDGNIYGGTFPNGHLFKYDPTASGNFSNAITDYGPVQTGATYARSLVWHDGKVYVGAGTPAGLIELDPATDTLRSIPIPSHIPVAEMVYGLETAGDYLSVRTEYPGNLTLFDPASEEWRMIGVSSGLVASPPSQDGNIYYRNEAGGLASYDLDTKTVGETSFASISNTRTMGWADITDQGYTGETLVWFDNRGTLYHYNPGTDTARTMQAELQGVPVVIHSIGVGTDGIVYTSGYVSGGLASYNPDTGDQHTFSGGIGQVDSFLRDGSRLWLGAYTRANLWELDSSIGTDGAGSTTRHFMLHDQHQDRIMALGQVGQTIVLGTVAEYGVNGGAITVYDLASDNPTPVVYRDIVQDHAVVSLVGDSLSDSGIVYGGTTVDGGLGSTPTSTQGKVFAFNTNTGQKLWEVDAVPGERAVTALTLSATGTLWGVGTGTLFEMDPSDGTILQSKKLVDPPVTDFVWMGSAVDIGPDGMLYVYAGRQVMQVNPTDLSVIPLIQNTVAYAADLPNQTLYFARSTDLHSADISALLQDVELSDDSTLAQFYVNDEPLNGFDPQQTTYGQQLQLQDAIPSVRVVASDINARVNIQRSATVPGQTTVTVTAADGQSQTVYTLDLSLDPDSTVNNLVLPQITGDLELGATLTASVGEWDYANIDLAIAWYRDGVLIPAQTGPEYVVSAQDIGTTLHVEITATVPDTDIETIANSAGSLVAEQPRLQLSTQQVNPGDALTVTVSGMMIGTEFEVILGDGQSQLRSLGAGEVVGQGTIAESGQVVLTIPIPADQTVGSYSLSLMTEAGEVDSVNFDVVLADAGPGEPDPGDGPGEEPGEEPGDQDEGAGDLPGSDSGNLPRTGSSVMTLLFIAVLLIMAGGGVALARIRQN